LDRLDAAKKLAAIVGRKEKSSETRYEIHTGSWIEHLDASVLRRNDRLLVAQSICERIVEGATHRWLRLLPPESTAVWSRLRTATRALTKGDASVCDQAAGLAKRIVDDIEALPVNTYGQAWKGYLLDVTRPFLEEPGNVQSPSFNRTSLAETIKRWTRMEGGVFADPDLSAEEIGAISEIAGI
jgi:hypothetical protein